MTATVIHGDCRETLKQLKAGSVHCAVTSPPYFALRSYLPKDHPDKALEIGSEKSIGAFVETMVDVFREVKRVLHPSGVCWINLGDTRGDTRGGGRGGNQAESEFRKQATNAGSLIDAFDSGLPAGNLCGIPWRVAFALQADGWILRDAIVWAKGVSGEKRFGSVMPESVSGCAYRRCRVKVSGSRRAAEHMKASANGQSMNLHRAAIEGRIDDPHATWSECPGCSKCSATGGWVLRRGSGRCAAAYEMLFMLTKGKGYFFDLEAVKEKSCDTTNSKGSKLTPPKEAANAAAGNGHAGWEAMTPDKVDDATPRNVMFWPTTPYPQAHFACVDSDTECLTIDGWKRHDQIGVGDVAAQFDMQTQMLSWGVVESVAHYNVTNQEMVVGATRDMNMLLTPNHRTVVLMRDGRNGGHQPPQIIEAANLKSGHNIPTAAPWVPCGMSPVNAQWAELIGWYLSEGYECKQTANVEIYQSPTANGDKVDRIRQLLRDIEAEWYEATGARMWRGERRESTAFKIRGYAAMKLRELCPGKMFPEGFLAWATPELQALADGLVLGDGHIRTDDRRTFVQKNIARVDAFQALMIRLGYSATLTGRAGGCKAVYITKHRRRGFRGTNGKHYGALPRTSYSGIVWCPKLPHGTWVARRQGRVFITGNTFTPDLPTFCIKASTSEHGVCPQCLAPYARMVESKQLTRERPNDKTARHNEGHGVNSCGNTVAGVESKTVGWKATCKCEAGEPIPATVCDPFTGSGTTGVAALELGRSFIGCELSETYIAEHIEPRLAAVKRRYALLDRV